MTLKELLLADLERQDFYSGNPNAQKSLSRVMFKAFSPRFAPIVLYRLSYFFAQHRLASLAKIFSLLNFLLFGLEISMRTEIGGGLYLPHTIGTVISAKKIGERCVIFHQVTLGAKEVDFAFSSEKRPVLGNDVQVGTGAKVLGGIKIGNRVKIGANAVVLKDVPSDSIAIGIPAINKRIEAAHESV
jgi:serine O-acetyltransferase